MTAEQKNLIYNLRKAGQSYTVIADKLGFSKSAVATYCQRNGLGSILVENNLITKSNRVKVGDAEKPGGFISKASRAYIRLLDLYLSYLGQHGALVFRDIPFRGGRIRPRAQLVFCQ